eukprot:5458629-Amphidinium_carterae.1
MEDLHILSNRYHKVEFCESYIIAALIMDDKNNRVSTVATFSDVPFFQTLNLQGRLLEASVVYGMQPEQLESA